MKRLYVKTKKKKKRKRDLDNYSMSKSQWQHLSGIAYKRAMLFRHGIYTVASCGMLHVPSIARIMSGQRDLQTGSVSNSILYLCMYQLSNLS